MATISNFEIIVGSTVVYVSVAPYCREGVHHALCLQFAFKENAWNCYSEFKTFEDVGFHDLTNFEVMERAKKYFTADKVRELEKQVSVQERHMKSLEAQILSNEIARQNLQKKEDRKMKSKGYKFRVPAVVHGEGDDRVVDVYTDTFDKSSVITLIKTLAKKTNMVVHHVDVGGFVAI